MLEKTLLRLRSKNDLQGATVERKWKQPMKEAVHEDWYMMYHRSWLWCNGK
jgi:hypothetical protein